jgi:hypothetical protein
VNGELTALELADDAFAAPDPGFGARLAAIRAGAAADGVTLAVDLHGALVELRFDRWTLNRPPHELAELVRRLAAEAAADALRQGRALLGDLLPEEPGDHRPRESRRRARPPEEDSLMPRTWAT